MLPTEVAFCSFPRPCERTSGLIKRARHATAHPTENAGRNLEAITILVVLVPSGLKAWLMEQVFWRFVYSCDVRIWNNIRPLMKNVKTGRNGFPAPREKQGLNIVATNLQMQFYQQYRTHTRLSL